MQAGGIRTKLKHIAEHRNAAAGTGHLRQGRQRGFDRQGVGIITVVDKQCAPRQGTQVEASGDRPVACQPAGDRSGVDSERRRRGSGRQSIEYIVTTRNMQAHQNFGAAHAQPEGRITLPQPEIPSAHLSIRAHSEQHTFYAIGHRQRTHSKVIAIDDGRTSRRKGGIKLSFGPGHPFDPSQGVKMRMADICNYANLGTGNLHQPCNLAPGTHPHFHHRPLMARGIEPKQGQGHADQVVEIAFGLKPVSRFFQNGREHLLGGRLPR